MRGRAVDAAHPPSPHHSHCPASTARPLITIPSRRHRARQRRRAETPRICQARASARSTRPRAPRHDRVPQTAHQVPQPPSTTLLVDLPRSSEQPQNGAVSLADASAPQTNISERGCGGAQPARARPVREARRPSAGRRRCGRAIASLLIDAFPAANSHGFTFEFSSASDSAPSSGQDSSASQQAWKPCRYLIGKRTYLASTAATPPCAPTKPPAQAATRRSLRCG